MPPSPHLRQAATATLGMESSIERQDVFTHMDGRVVISRLDEKAVTVDNLEELKTKYGASSYTLYDDLYDTTFTYYPDDYYINYLAPAIDFKYGIDYSGAISNGRKPNGDYEILLYLPIYMKDRINKIDMKIKLYNCEYTVVGYKYFYDNNKIAKIYLTKTGFEKLTTFYYMSLFSAVSYNVYSEEEFQSFSYVGIDNSLSDTEIVVKYPYNSNHVFFEGVTNATIRTSYKLDDESKIPVTIKNTTTCSGDLGELYINYNLAQQLVKQFIDEKHIQASLFFSSDSKAKSKISEIKQDGYNAILSSATTLGSTALILQVVVKVSSILGWLLAIVFLTLFIRIIFSRSLLTEKNDIAIFRSMGLKSSIVKMSMYSEVAMSTFGGLICGIIFCLAMYLTKGNQFLPFLSWWHYLLIVLGVILIVERLARLFNKKIYKQSVRKNMAGGSKK